MSEHATQPSGQLTPTDLTSNNELFRAIVNAVPECVKLVGRDGRLLSINPAGLSMIGVASEDEIRGQQVYDMIAPEHVDAYRTLNERVFAGEPGELEYDVIGADGGRWHLHTNATPLKGPADQVIAHLAVTRDITAQRQAEAERSQLEAQLRHSQKMEAIGQLAAGVAHEFNNLLVGVLGNTEFMLSAPAGHIPAEYRDCIEDISRSGERAASLTQDLLTFSKRKTQRVSAFDVNEVIGNMHGVLRRLIGAQIEFDMTLSPDSTWVRAGEAEIEQIMMNLALNARDAMPEGGKLTIRTQPVTLDEVQVRAHPGAQPGAHVELYVGDNGCGIEPGDLERVFEPFYTTKPTGKGTGLGLSTVYSIIKKCGGHIDVSSRLEVGTIMRVYLPQASPTSPPKPKPADRRDGHESILLCDDNPTVLKVLTKTLTDAGYRVTAAAGGPQALQAVFEEGLAVDLLLTDVVMPGISGPVLAERLRAASPGMPVILMSGYAADVLDPEVLENDDFDFLQKPPMGTIILDKIRDLFSRTAARREPYAAV